MHRILRITNRFNLGGPTLNVGYLSKYLENNYETLILGGLNEETEANSEFILNNLGLQPVLLPEMKREISLKNDIIAYRKIKSIISEFKPDIVHTHASKAGALGRLAAYRMNVPIIVHTFHGHVFDSYFSKRKTNFYIKLERYLATKSDAIITLSTNQFHDIVDKYKVSTAEKTSIISLGFDLNKFYENQVEKRKQFRKQYDVKDDQIAIGIIGRLVPVKNHKLFVEVLNLLISKYGQKIRAFIVGDGESKAEIENLLNNANISFSNNNSLQAKQVVFTSWQKDIDIVNAGLDIVALTSLNEGTPVSLIEALAAGKAIVATRVGGVENIIEHQETGLLSSLSCIDFFEKIDELINNNELRENLGNNGKQKVFFKFHYSRLVSETDELYQNLIQKKIKK